MGSTSSRATGNLEATGEVGVPNTPDTVFMVSEGESQSRPITNSDTITPTTTKQYSAIFKANLRDLAREGTAEELEAFLMGHATDDESKDAISKLKLDYDNNTVFHLLAKRDDSSHLEVALTYLPANIRNKHGDFPIHIATSCNNPELVTLLAKHFPETVNSKNRMGNTPLLNSARRGKNDAAKALLKLGANPTIPDNYGFLPIDKAASRNNPELVTLLAKRYPETINGKDSLGNTLLFNSTNLGNTDVARALLNIGADPTIPDADGNLPIHRAASRNNPELVALLAKSRPETINSKGCLGNTPLHIAASSGKVESARALLEVGADPTIPNADGNLPIHKAASRNNPELVTLLAKRCPKTVNSKNRMGNTPLHIAASSGKVESARALLEAGADPTIPNADGNLPIHKAASHNNPELVILLAKRCPDTVNCKNHCGSAPLHLVTNIGVAKALLKKGGSPKTLDNLNNLPIHKAASSDKPELVALLAKRCPDTVNCKNRMGNTPLLNSTNLGSTDAARALLNIGADPTIPDAYGNLPIHNAAAKNHLELVTLLAEHSPETLNTKDIRGNTPINRMWKTDNVDFVGSLLKLGADPTIPDANGNLPIHKAAANNHLELVILLAEHSPETLNTKDERGVTPINHIWKTDNVDFVGSLLKLGADPTIPDADGNLPIHKAAANNHLELVILLAEHSPETLNTKDERGVTPINHIWKTGNVEVVRELAKLGAKSIDTNAPEEFKTAFAEERKEYLKTESGRWQIKKDLVDLAERSTKIDLPLNHKHIVLRERQSALMQRKYYSEFPRVLGVKKVDGTPIDTSSTPLEPGEEKELSRLNADELFRIANLAQFLKRITYTSCSSLAVSKAEAIRTDNTDELARLEALECSEKQIGNDAEVDGFVAKTVIGFFTEQLEAEETNVGLKL